MTILGILAGILILGLIMVIHELGHYLAGRFFKIKITQFSIFMGPVLFEREKNGIHYNIKAFPIGASVSFAGEASEIEGEEDDPNIDPDDPSLFNNKPRWQRAIVVVMGPLLNFLTAFLVFSILFTVQGVITPVVGRVDRNTLIEQSGIEVGDRILSVNTTRVHTTLDFTIAEMVREQDEAWVISYRKPSGERKRTTIYPAKSPPRPMLGIVYVEDNGRYIIQEVNQAADHGVDGFQKGDAVISIEHVPFNDHRRITEIISESEGRELTAEIERGRVPMTITVKPIMLETDIPLGIVMTKSASAADILSQGFHYPISVLRSTFRALGMVFSGKIAVRDSVAGPIGIVSMAAETVKHGKTFGEIIAKLATFLGLLSVAVGFTNLLPIPPLDGNHLLLITVEAIRRKPLSKKFKMTASTIGVIFILLLGLAVIVLDLMRLFGW
ncbi:MAG TPA: RIP metalloprotease RseP [Clostridiaceae bacterium]|nr:RIP metalloprotease RseP [Clostridiaceae bacterium]